jgi:hypothetical protein
VPVIVTELVAATALVVTVKVVVVLLAGTVTLDGIVATAVLLLDRVTTAPPAGAATLRVIVAVEEFPPTTLPGASVSPFSVGKGGVIVPETGVFRSC